MPDFLCSNCFGWMQPRPDGQLRSWVVLQAAGVLVIVHLTWKSLLFDGQPVYGLCFFECLAQGTMFVFMHSREG